MISKYLPLVRTKSGRFWTEQMAGKQALFTSPQLSALQSNPEYPEFLSDSWDLVQHGL